MLITAILVTASAKVAVGVDSRGALDLSLGLGSNDKDIIDIDLYATKEKMDTADAGDMEEINDMVAAPVDCLNTPIDSCSKKKECRLGRGTKLDNEEYNAYKDEAQKACGTVMRDHCTNIEIGEGTYKGYPTCKTAKKCDRPKRRICQARDEEAKKPPAPARPPGCTPASPPGTETCTQCIGCQGKGSLHDFSIGNGARAEWRWLEKSEKCVSWADILAGKVDPKDGAAISNPAKCPETTETASTAKTEPPAPKQAVDCKTVAVKSGDCKKQDGCHPAGRGEFKAYKKEATDGCGSKTTGARGGQCSNPNIAAGTYKGYPTCTSTEQCSKPCLTD